MNRELIENHAQKIVDQLWDTGYLPKEYKEDWFTTIYLILLDLILEVDNSRGMEITHDEILEEMKIGRGENEL